MSIENSEIFRGCNDLVKNIILYLMTIPMYGKNYEHNKEYKMTDAKTLDNYIEDRTTYLYKAIVFDSDPDIKCNRNYVTDYIIMVGDPNCDSEICENTEYFISAVKSMFMNIFIVLGYIHSDDLEKFMNNFGSKFMDILVDHDFNVDMTIIGAV